MRNLINLVESLLEYREETGGTFTHNGETYNLNAAFKIVEDRPIYNLPVADMSWVLQYDEVDPARLARADLTAPLLVTVLDGNLTVIDGLHRLAKAEENQVDSLPAVIIAPCRLSECLADHDARKAGCDDDDFILYYEHSDEDDSTMWFFLPEMEDSVLDDQMTIISPNQASDA